MTPATLAVEKARLWIDRRPGNHSHQEQLQSELSVLQAQGKQEEDSTRQTRQCGLGLSSDAGAIFPLSYTRETRIEGEESFWGGHWSLAPPPVLAHTPLVSQPAGLLLSPSPLSGPGISLTLHSGGFGE